MGESLDGAYICSSRLLQYSRFLNCARQVAEWTNIDDADGVFLRRRPSLCPLHHLPLHCLLLANGPTWWSNASAMTLRSSGGTLLRRVEWSAL